MGLHEESASEILEVSLWPLRENPGILSARLDESEELMSFIPGGLARELGLAPKQCVACNHQSTHNDNCTWRSVAGKDVCSRCFTKDFDALSVALRRLAEKKGNVFSYTPFCGALEGSIRDLDPETVPLHQRTPEERAISGGRREIQHRRIVEMLVNQLGLNELVERRVDERHTVYVADAIVLGEPEPKREDRYVTAREWVINEYIRRMSASELKMMAEFAMMLM